MRTNRIKKTKTKEIIEIVFKKGVKSLEFKRSK